jgi:hypothetical protein
MDQQPGDQQPGDQQRRIETPNVQVPPPPPRQGLGTGAKIAIGGCITLFVLGLLVVGGCFVLIATVEPPTDSGSGSSKEKQESGSSKGREPTVAIREPVTVGDVQWTVTNARTAKQLRQEEFGQFGETKRGDFVIVDFDFTNRSSEPITLSQQSLALIDSSGNKSEPDTDTFGYIPRNRNIFLEQVNPGVTKQGQVIFTVASGASGFKLQAGDADVWTDENGYVDLGF